MTRLLDALARWVAGYRRISAGLVCVGLPKRWVPARLRSWAFDRVLRHVAALTEIAEEEEHGVQ